MKPLEERNKIADFFPEGYKPKNNQVEFVQTYLNYRKAGIFIEELEWDQEELNEGWNPNMARKVKITQKRLLNGYILNQRQLVERVTEMYKLLGREVKVRPVVWSFDADTITIDWIKEKMDEFGIARNDLIKQLAFDKSSLSLFLNGERKMAKSVKATFFYYFLNYEINRDLRSQI